MIASDIKELLPSEWPVTVGDLPSANVEAIGLIEFDGYFNTMYLGMRYTSILQPLVKVVARSKSYAQGEFWVDRAKEILNGYRDPNQEKILSITMVGVPTYLGRNTQKFHEFQVVFQVQVKE